MTYHCTFNPSFNEIGKMLFRGPIFNNKGLLIGDLCCYEHDKNVRLLWKLNYSYDVLLRECFICYLLNALSSYAFE